MAEAKTAALAAKNGQRENARRATLQMMQDKKPAEREFSTKLSPDDDEPVSFLLRALSAKAYDKLVAQHPATTEQQAEGATFNVDTFAPALLSRVVKEPEVTESQWADFWESPNWGRGEIASLYFACSEICNRGLDLAPFAPA